MEESSSDVELLEEKRPRLSLSKPIIKKKKTTQSTLNHFASFGDKSLQPHTVEEKSLVDSAQNSFSDVTVLNEKPRLSLSKTLRKKNASAGKECQQSATRQTTPCSIKTIYLDHSDGNNSSDVEAFEENCVRFSLSKETSDSLNSTPISQKGNQSNDSQSSPRSSITQEKISVLISPKKQSFKLSKSLSQSPNKFIVSDNVKLSPKKRNSPTKKLIVNSPVRYMKKKSPYRNTASMSGSRSFSSSPFKKNLFDSPQSSERAEENGQMYRETLDRINAANFCKVLTEVMLSSKETNIFNEEELKIVTDFLEMPWQNKELYIRMYVRKAGWHRVSNIHYNNISSDLLPVFKDLASENFVTFDYKEENSDTLLRLLQVAELKLLCKVLKLKIPSKCNKLDLIKNLLDFSCCQQTLNFVNKNTIKPIINGSSAVLMSKLGEVLNDCITLSSGPRQIFRRMFLLFSLSRTSSTEEQEDVSQYLLLMHFVDIGKMTFPNYHMIKYPIFKTREHFLSFEKAREVETLLTEIIEKKRWNSISDVTHHALEAFALILQDDAITENDQALPEFLRRFTGGSTFAYALSIAAEAMRKIASLVSEAIVIFQKLLAQKLYLIGYRGRWYEQMALLHQQKMRNNTEATRVIIAGLTDALVTEIWRHTLFDRGTMLVRRKTGQPADAVRQNLIDIIDQMNQLQEPSIVKIVSKSLENNKPGFKKVYVQVDHDMGETTYSSVEEFALSHYRSQGFVGGMHCEGMIIVSLFGLFFWDIIYEMPVPGVFQSAYQSEPLDLRSMEFYSNRSEVVDKRLKDMSQWSDDENKSFIEEVFLNHRDKISIVNWERLQSASQVIEIVKCINVSVVSKICARLVKQFRSTRSGFPDLLVWNSDSRHCKFIEVKGKGDQLSMKQRIWLDYLIKVGADAEVCHVHHS